MNCPECGADGCEERYHACLVQEFTDPGYGAVHHLTVAAYMLQHSSKLTKEGWEYERKLLRAFLVENQSPEQVRSRSKAVVDSGKRKFKIASKGGLPVIAKIMWAKTILDVRMENAESYCADVTEWASSVLENVKGLMD
jgi:hypothetical protein